MNQAPRERIVLLFCHGGSFNKESWAPILARLKVSAILNRVPCELVAFDWRYHGAKRSDADKATLYYEDGDKSAPRVEHPGKHWPEWTPSDLIETIKQLTQEDAKLNRKTRIVGIGHSMGAATLLNVEIHHPGTFEGLVLFEPPITIGEVPEGAKWAASAMVINTLTRVEEWSSWDSVLEHFKTGKAYRRWHPESLEAFLRGGIITTPKGKFRLAMPLIQEASLYCHKIMAFTLEQYARVQCPVVFEYGDHTQLFNLPVAHEIANTLPDKYKLAEPLEGKTHLTVVEDPEMCARNIAESLATLPLFKARTSNSSKL